MTNIIDCVFFPKRHGPTSCTAVCEEFILCTGASLVLQPDSLNLHKQHVRTRLQRVL